VITPTFFEIAEYFGSSHKAKEVLAKYAFDGERPTIPIDWDWSEIQARFYVPEHATPWLLTQILKELVKLNMM